MCAVCERVKGAGREAHERKGEEKWKVFPSSLFTDFHSETISTCWLYKVRWKLRETEREGRRKPESGDAITR